MYNYYTDLIWKIDKVFLYATVFVSFIIIIYTAIKERLERKRGRILIGLRNSLQNLTLQGHQVFKDFCSDLINKSTPQQFLDIAKNPETIISKEFEVSLKECFINSGKISRLEKVAKKSMNKWRRIEAIISLGYASSPSTLGILKNSLLDRDEDISYFSMLALGEIKNILSARILLDFLGKHAFSGYKIVSLLEDFPSVIIEEVLKKIEDPDPFVRFWAMKLLSKFKAEHQLDKIEKFTQDESADVRAASCECLGELGLAQARDTLLRCLKDKEWFVRMHAVRSLSKIMGEDCIPAVITLIKDSEWPVRESVKKAMISHIGISLPYIEQFLYGDDEAIKRDCIEAIEDSGYLVLLLKGVVSEEAQVKGRARRLLERMLKSGLHLGLQSALADFPEDLGKKILAVINDIGFVNS